VWGLFWGVCGGGGEGGAVLGVKPQHPSQLGGQERLEHTLFEVGWDISTHVELELERDLIEHSPVASDSTRRQKSHGRCPRLAGRGQEGFGLNV
jgi:hypothetical protein